MEVINIIDILEKLECDIDYIKEMAENNSFTNVVIEEIRKFEAVVI